MDNNYGIKAYDGDDFYIFISYSHKDSEKVYPFIAALQKNYNVWFDEGIHYGFEWEEEIAEKLRYCSIFIFMITENSLNSDNCKDELHHARNLGKKFLNVLVDRDTVLPEWFTFRYGRYQMCNYFTFSSSDEAIRDLERKCDWFEKLKDGTIVLETEKTKKEYKYHENENTDVKTDPKPTILITEKPTQKSPGPDFSGTPFSDGVQTEEEKRKPPKSNIRQQNVEMDISSEETLCLIFGVLSILIAVVGIVFGIIALKKTKKIKKFAGQLQGKAKIGYVLGLIGTIWCSLLILAALIELIPLLVYIAK